MRPLFSLLFFLLIPLFGLYAQEDEDTCRFVFDFGYGDQRECSDSLIKKGIFTYGSLMPKKMAFNKTAIDYFPYQKIYSLPGIIIKAKSNLISLKKPGNKNWQTVNIRKHFNLDLDTLSGPMDEVIVWSAYSFKMNGHLYYVLFIGPDAPPRYYTPYKPILIDMSGGFIKVVPMPGFQHSTSPGSMNCVVRQGKECLVYYPLNTQLSEGPDDLKVYLFSYINGKFIKDRTNYLKLVSDAGPFIYRIDWRASKWDFK
ncbi:MAG: hypothetical protein V4543_14540 [Bacteroidota bacterium]